MNDLIVKKGAGLQSSSLLPETQSHAWSLKIYTTENDTMASIKLEKPRDVASVNDEFKASSGEFRFARTNEACVPKHENGDGSIGKSVGKKRDMHTVSTLWRHLINRNALSSTTRGRENQCLCGEPLRVDGAAALCHFCGHSTSC